MAVLIISSMGTEPSDQLECRCRSPLSASRIAPPPVLLALARSCSSVAGTFPAHASAATVAVFGPRPVRLFHVLLAPWRCRSWGLSPAMISAALR
ncbi:Uncharacterised protein [Mycobacteroides abscessus subsp. abscessus]|nr:Uncharacterised protein [Mycobacteroides abscessus subsp. abscessus]